PLRLHGRARSRGRAAVGPPRAWLASAGRAARLRAAVAPMTASDAVLYYAHFSSPAVRREVGRLREQLGGRYDVFVVGYCGFGDLLDSIGAAPALAFTDDHLRELPYPLKLASLQAEGFIGNTALVP